MTSLGQPWDERWRLILAAAGAITGAFVAMGEVDFDLVASLLLPLVPAAFVAKARWPWLPNLVVALPALAIPVTLNIIYDTDVEFSMFLLVLATVVISSVERDRRQTTGFAVSSIVIIFVLSVVGVLDWSWANWVAALILSWAFGTAVFHYDRVLTELRAAQAELVDQAALHERRRIARDVHDLVGHSLSVVMLHVAGARRLLRTDPDEAEVALRQAEEAGRSSMAEVRRTVGLLRAGDDGEGSAPAPVLGDIATVVDQYRAAGMSVDLQLDGPIEDVAGPQSVACHRIVQEALANVSKHTAGADVEVSVEVDHQRCQVAVRNRGGQVLPPPATLSDSPGHGLVGMRERALSVGGSLLAGPVDGGWSVEVTVPRNGAER